MCGFQAVGFGTAGVSKSTEQNDKEKVMKLWISTPAYGGQVRYEYMTSCMRLQSYCNRMGIPTIFHLVAGESLITRARNELVNFFLKSDATHFLSWDADIQAEPEDVMKLINANVDVIGATYPIKRLPLHYVVNHIEGVSSPTKVSEVACIGTGLLLIKRKVFEKLKEGYPNDFYFSDTGDNVGERIQCYFDTGIREGRYLSEDYWFCDNYRKLGGKVHIEPTIRLGHVGFFNYGK